MAVTQTDILQMTIEGLVNGQTVLSVYHFVVTAVPAQVDPILSQEQFLALVQTGGTFDLETTYRDCLSADYTCIRLIAQYIWPTRIRRSTTASGRLGTRAGACNAPNVSGVIEKQTDRAGRAYRGSLHLPGLSQNDFVSGTMTAGWKSIALLHANKIPQIVSEAPGPGRWTPTIYHRLLLPAGTSSTITKCVVMPTLRVMRRRTVGVGK